MLEREPEVSVVTPPTATLTLSNIQHPSPTAFPSVTPRPTNTPKSQTLTNTKPPSPTAFPSITPRPTNTPRSSVSRSEIENLLLRWDAIHHRADGPRWDTSELSSVLRGNALSQQKETVANLKKSNCYWTVKELAAPRVVRFDIIDSDFLVVESRKNWDMTLYCNSRKTKDDDGPFTMQYEIERINNRWYITHKFVSRDH